MAAARRLGTDAAKQSLTANSEAMPRQQIRDTTDGNQILAGGDLQHSFVDTGGADRGRNCSAHRLHGRWLARSLLKVKD